MYCEPAQCGLDSLQAQLGSSEVITVTNHCTVWCPWDPFATPQTIARAAWYDVYAVPQVRIDGKYVEVGAGSCASAYDAYQAKVSQRLAETGGQSPIEISGGYEEREGSLYAYGVFRLVDPVALSDLRTTILVYEDSVYATGECFYDSLFNRVTRVIKDETIVLSGVGDEEVVGTCIPIDPSWNPARLRVVAYVQRTTADKEIYQAGFLPQEATAVAPPRLLPVTGIESAWPNPFRGAVEIALTLSPAAAVSPIRLEVFDASGRRVADVFEGVARAGRRTCVWDGRLPAGEAAGSGIYFARLATCEGQTFRKLIRLRP
jgi:hypothetical protein